MVLFKYFGGGEVELRDVVRTPSGQQETIQGAETYYTYSVCVCAGFLLGGGGGGGGGIRPPLKTFAPPWRIESSNLKQ